MRVLMVSKALVVGSYHRKLEELARLGVDLHLVIPPRWGKQDAEKTKGAGYEIHQLPVILSGHNHFHYYRGMDVMIDAIQPEIIHIDEEAHSFVTFQVMRLARRRSIPALFFNWQNIQKRYPFPFSAVEKYNFRNASAGIAGNKEAKEVLQKKGCSIPLYVIPQFGVDPQDFSPRESSSLKRELFGSDRVIVVGYGGRLVYEKGLFVLLMAFCRLPKETRLLLVGGGPLEEALVEEARSVGVRDRVLIRNHVPSSQMPEYLSCMDVLALPSITRPHWKEQFGRILIEAMACGVPVVGSDSGEIPNVIGDAGLIAAEGDVDALSAKLLSVIQDESLRSALSMAGRARVSKYFTHRRIAEETVAVYRSITGRAA